MQPHPPPAHLHLERSRGLTVDWGKGDTVFYPVEWLRKMSPSADQRELREEMDRNPLTVLPNATSQKPIEASSMEFVGNYAIRINFNDGHNTGIYSWAYLREIEPGKQSP